MENQNRSNLALEAVDPLEFSFSKESYNRNLSTLGTLNSSDEQQPSDRASKTSRLNDTDFKRLSRPLFQPRSIPKLQHARHLTELEDPERRPFRRGSVLKKQTLPSLPNVYMKEHMREI